MRGKYKSLAIIAENLGELYEGGIDISLAIELISELPLGKVYKRSLLEIRENILNGENLSDTFRLYPKLYPEFFVGMIEVGEQNGDISKVLFSLHKYYDKQDRMKRTIINTSIYPIFIIASMIILLLFLIFFLVPSFYESFNNSTDSVPSIITNIIKFKEFASRDTMLFFLQSICYAIVIPAILIKGLFKSRSKASFISKIKLGREIYEYVFILILSVVCNSGIPISVGIEYAINSSNVLPVKSLLKKLNNDILRGMEIGESLDKSILISKYTLAMIKLGERSGTLASTINKLEGRLEKENDIKVKSVIEFIQPIMIFAMAIAVGAFIVIFILPMFDMVYSGVM